MVIVALHSFPSGRARDSWRKERNCLLLVNFYIILYLKGLSNYCGYSLLGWGSAHQSEFTCFVHLSFSLFISCYSYSGANNSNNVITNLDLDISVSQYNCPFIFMYSFLWRTSWLCSQSQLYQDKRESLKVCESCK